MLSAVLVWCLNHKQGSYKSQIQDTLRTEFAVQTVALTKSQVDCKNDIVTAIQALKD